jgi:hypothetical protein
MGWNLVSVPLQLTGDNTVETVFSDDAVRSSLATDHSEKRSLSDGLRGTVYVGSVWQWVNEGMEGTYAYELADQVEPLTGYWVYAEAPTVVTVAGRPLDAPMLTLMTGWNLIGVDRFVIPAEENATLLRARLWTWDAVETFYHVVEKLRPGLGYWLNANDDNVTLPLHGIGSMTDEEGER